MPLLQDAAEDPGLNEAALKKLIEARYTAGGTAGSELSEWGMYTMLLLRSARHSTQTRRWTSSTQTR